MFSVRDDRGTRRRVVDVVRIRNTAPLIQRGAVLLGFAGIAAAYVVACASVFLTLRRAGLALGYVIPGVLGGSCLLAALLAWMVRRQLRLHAGFFIDSCKDGGVCACCAYQLEGLPRDRDGCTICPECGAAWKMWPGPIDRRSG